MKEHILKHSDRKHHANVSLVMDAFAKAKAEGAAMVVKAKATNDTSAMDKAHEAGLAATKHIKPQDFAAVIQVVGRLEGAAEELAKG
jgi:hypothetical protein